MWKAPSTCEAARPARGQEVGAQDLPELRLAEQADLSKSATPEEGSCGNTTQHQQILCLDKIQSFEHISNIQTCDCKETFVEFIIHKD